MEYEDNMRLRRFENFEQTTLISGLSGNSYSAQVPIMRIRAYMEFRGVVDVLEREGRPW